MTVTVFERVALTGKKRVYGDYGDYDMTTRTRRGKHVLKMIGECIKGGGYVTASTTQDKSSGMETITATLHWKEKP